MNNNDYLAFLGKELARHWKTDPIIEPIFDGLAETHGKKEVRQLREDVLAWITVSKMVLGGALLSQIDPAGIFRAAASAVLVKRHGAAQVAEIATAVDQLVRPQGFDVHEFTETVIVGSGYQRTVGAWTFARHTAGQVVPLSLEATLGIVEDCWRKHASESID